MTWRAAGALLLVTVGDLAGQAPFCDGDGWREVLGAHAARYPLMTFEDTYKLLHQGIFGSEHAVPDEASARAFLQDEIATLGAGPVGASSTPMIEPIAPGGAIVRVHLRPFLAAGGDREALLAAFLTTGRSPRGSVEELRCAAAVASALDTRRWPADAWPSFVDDLIERGLPAIHHSAPFHDAYAPAYRVIAGELATGLTPGRE